MYLGDGQGIRRSCRKVKGSNPTDETSSNDFIFRSNRPRYAGPRSAIGRAPDS